MYDDLTCDYNKSLSANILVVGKSGVGKSSLLNYLFDKEVEKTGSGFPVTDYGVYRHEYQYDEQFKVNIYDSWGLEAGRADKWRKMLIDKVHEHDRMEINEWFNTIIYCTSVVADRFEDFEINIINELREKKNNVIVAITHCKSEDDEKAINFRNERICPQTGLKEDDVVLVSSVQKKLISGTETVRFGKERIFKMIIRNLWRTFKEKLTYNVQYGVNERFDHYRKSMESIIDDGLSSILFRKNDLDNVFKDINLQLDALFDELPKITNDKYKDAYDYYDALSVKYCSIGSLGKYIDKGKLKNNIRSFKPSNSFKQKAKETLKKIDQKTKLNMSEKNKMVEFVEKLHVGLSTSKTIKKELLEYVGKYYDELEKVFKISLDEIEAYLEELDIEEIYNVE